MAPRVTRRNFMLFVTGTAGAYLVSCKPAESNVPAGVPTLVAPGGAPDNGADRTRPADYSNPDPLYGDVTFDQAVFITPTEDFYIQTFGAFGDGETEGWTLTIDGLVDNPIALNYDDILAMEAITTMRTLECIGNPVGGDLVGNANWTGVRLKPILEEAGIQESAVRAQFEATDNYVTSVDLEWILQDDTLLVYAMNGEPLTRAHGYPLRIMMPGLYGQKMPKWLSRIEFIDHKSLGFWERQGWSDTADVQTNSQVASPRNLRQIHGSFAIQGWAYAGLRKITKVEVQIDEGEWIECDLLDNDNSLVWTQWWTTWTPTETGAFSVAVRATDDDGFTQDIKGDLLGSAYPNGTTAIHSVAYTAKDPAES